MKKQQGFTVFELMVCIIFLATVVFVGWGGYKLYLVAEHFIMKWW